MSKEADEKASEILRLPESKPPHPESTPVRYCDLLAATHNKNKFYEIHEAMHNNLRLEHFEILPCTCTPRCPQMNMAEQMVLAELFKDDPGTLKLKRAISGDQ